MKTILAVIILLASAICGFGQLPVPVVTPVPVNEETLVEETLVDLIDFRYSASAAAIRIVWRNSPDVMQCSTAEFNEAAVNVGVDINILAQQLGKVYDEIRRLRALPTPTPTPLPTP